MRTAGHVVQRRRYLRRQSLIFDCKRRRQLPGRSGAQQRCGDSGSISHPEQRDLQRGQLQAISGADNRLNDSAGPLLEVGLDEPGEVIGRRPRPARCAGPVLPT